MKSIVVALLALALSACGPKVYCQTRCGLELTQAGDCIALQAQEDYALAVYANLGLFDVAGACSMLAGYQVSVAENSDGRSFVDPWKRTVAGETDCAGGTILVANQRWHAQSNALSHEMIHAITDCFEVDGDSHYHWAELGYYAAIDAARPDAD